jgi:hypothetical protein
MTLQELEKRYIQLLKQYNDLDDEFFKCKEEMLILETQLEKYKLIKKDITNKYTILQDEISIIELAYLQLGGNRESVNPGIEERVTNILIKVFNVYKNE